MQWDYLGAKKTNSACTERTLDSICYSCVEYKTYLKNYLGYYEPRPDSKNEDKNFGYSVLSNINTKFIFSVN